MYPHSDPPEQYMKYREKIDAFSVYESRKNPCFSAETTGFVG
jgi:hypothetical protein